MVPERLQPSFVPPTCPFGSGVAHRYRASGPIVYCVNPEARPSTEDLDSVSVVFGDIEAHIEAAVDQAVTQRRRNGLSIAVDRGRGVELIP